MVRIRIISLARFSITFENVFKLYITSRTVVVIIRHSDVSLRHDLLTRETLPETL